jgi:hypothetical protein
VLPPSPRNQGADGIGGHVAEVAGSAPKKVRADDLKQTRPEGEMTNDLTDGGGLVVRAQAQAAVDEQERGKRAGDEEGVVKPEPEEGDVRVRPDPPPIYRIESGAAEAQRIEHISKPIHNSARMMAPAPSARSSFTEIISIQIP